MSNPTLVIATGNRYKAAEIRAVLGERFHYLSLADLPGAPVAVEDAPSFEGNAVEKATGLAGWLIERGLIPDGDTWWVLADDSGLEVDALGGAPGVRSARFAADAAGASGNVPDAANNAKLLRLLREVAAPARTARFRCVIALTRATPGAPTRMRAGGPTHVFAGTCAGTIGHEPRGTAGFGYDPLFVPQGSSQTFAQLGEDRKNAISHRARALSALVQWLDERGSP